MYKGLGREGTFKVWGLKTQLPKHIWGERDQEFSLGQENLNVYQILREAIALQAWVCKSGILALQTMTQA